MTDSYQLYRLQEIDITWLKVQKRLLKLQKLASSSGPLEQAGEKLAAVEEKLQTWQAEQTRSELESRSLAQRVREGESRLMSGAVTNPKELENLQASVEALKRQRNSLEDKSVQALMKIEEASQELTQERSTYESLRSDWEDQSGAVEGELLQRKKEFVYLKKLREQTAAKLDDDLLAEYERLRRRKNGVAVARVEDGVCGACHIQLPTGVVGEVRRGESLSTCAGCGRLLHSG